MKIGIAVRNSGESAVRAVQALPPEAEERGFDSVWFTDHVIGARSFQPVYEPEWVEALSALSYAAATTSRVQIGVSVLVAPYRDPVYAAKVLSSVDNLSAGRVVVGVGAGWSRVEYQALGRAGIYAARGSVTDETLAVIRRCWEGGEIDWSGEHFAFKGMIFAPTPVQERGPQLWIGGQSKRAIRRAARFGDAWHPTGRTPQEVAALGAELDELAGRLVPRMPRISISDFGAPELESLLERYRDAGCSGLVIASAARTLDDQRRVMDAVARKAGLPSAITSEAGS